MHACRGCVVVQQQELQHLLQGQLYLQYAVQTTAPLRELLQTVFCSVLSGDRFLSIACKQSEHYVGRTLYHRKSYKERQFCIVTNQHAKTQNNDPNNQPIHSQCLKTLCHDKFCTTHLMLLYISASLFQTVIVIILHDLLIYLSVDSTISLDCWC